MVNRFDGREGGRPPKDAAGEMPERPEHACHCPAEPWKAEPEGGRSAVAGQAHDHAHGHRHGHHHGHAHAIFSRAATKDERRRDRRRLVGTLSLTLTVMIVEAVGGWYSGSLALISDAGHMLTDAAALLLALLAMWFASRPADLKRTYGYFRLEILSALLNGLTLLLIAGVIAWEAFERLRNPQDIDVRVMMGVAVIGLMANMVGIVLLSRSKSMNVRAAFLHVLGDALSSIGVIVAAAIAWATGFKAVDSIVSILIAAVIVVGAVGLVREAVDVLLEAVPAHIDLPELFGAMKEIEGVLEVHDLHVWTIAHSMHALSAHLVVKSTGQLEQNDRILSRVKGVLRDRFGIDHTTIQIETERYASIHEMH